MIAKRRRKVGVWAIGTKIAFRGSEGPSRIIAAGTPMPQQRKRMIVRSRMTVDPITVSPEESLAAAQAKMNARRIRALPVVDAQGLIGMLTDRDIRQHLGFLQQTKVNAAMSTPLVTVSPSSTLEQAAQLVLEHKIGGLPVVEGGKLVGIITTSDLLGAFLELTGAGEEGTTRIDFASPGKESDVTAACNIVHREGGTTLSIGTYRDAAEDERVFYARIRAEDPDRIAKALGDGGYSVLDIFR
jgi:acetoin utilization protein AcuB